MSVWPCYDIRFFTTKIIFFSLSNVDINRIGKYFSWILFFLCEQREIKNNHWQRKKATATGMATTMSVVQKPTKFSFDCNRTRHVVDIVNRVFSQTEASHFQADGVKHSSALFMQLLKLKLNIMIWRQMIMN